MLAPPPSQIIGHVTVINRSRDGNGGWLVQCKVAVNKM